MLEKSGRNKLKKKIQQIKLRPWMRCLAPKSSKQQKDDYLWIYKINKNTEKKERSSVSDRNDLRMDWKSKIL